VLVRRSALPVNQDHLWRGARSPQLVPGWVRADDARSSIWRCWRVLGRSVA